VILHVATVQCEALLQADSNTQTQADSNTQTQGESEGQIQGTSGVRHEARGRDTRQAGETHSREGVGNGASASLCGVCLSLRYLLWLVSVFTLACLYTRLSRSVPCVCLYTSLCGLFLCVDLHSSCLSLHLALCVDSHSSCLSLHFALCVDSHSSCLSLHFALCVDSHSSCLSLRYHSSCLSLRYHSSFVMSVSIPPQVSLKCLYPPSRHRHKEDKEGQGAIEME